MSNVQFSHPEVSPLPTTESSWVHHSPSDQAQLDLTSMFHQLCQQQRKLPYPDYAMRQHLLAQLLSTLKLNQAALCQALAQDFAQRAIIESEILEILPCVQSIRYYQKRLKKLMRPQHRHISWLFWPGKNRVFFQPKGVVGIIVPWNYPVFLALGPIAAALAAGNRIMVKLPEATPRTNQVLRHTLAAIGNDWITVVEGDAHIAADFSQLPFDHLFFTGSTQIGRHVMRAASQHLTPVTLELGGKSPLLLAPDAELASSVSRLLFGKCMNAGQTCVAPDYVLVPHQQRQALVAEITQQFATFYPAGAQDKAYTHIINAAQWQRLGRYLQDAAQKGATIISTVPDWQWQAEPATGFYMPLQLILDAPPEAQVWHDEIFGPILPIKSYLTLDDAIAFIQARPRPLALYLFSHDGALQQRVLQQCHAGGVCINDTLTHVAQDDLPFGGIGPSGMGSYHGPEGFYTFSHAKAVHHKGVINGGIMAYPQWRERFFAPLLRFLLR
jgi:coniferyl-aldehyde dehydrogenase